MYRSTKKVAVVLPAYNASRTLQSTYEDIPPGWVDELILVDDGSQDDTVAIAEQLNIHHIIQHKHNRGYGANQKSCYQRALAIGADIIIMLHPDGQYTPRLIPAMVMLIDQGLYDVVLGSRILGGGARKSNMPTYKYVANRLLTGLQNTLWNQQLSEYHTGYRAFSRHVLTRIHFQANADGFVFDNQMLSQIIYHKFKIAEVTCPTKYFKEASSISFWRSVQYGFGVLGVTLQHMLAKLGIYESEMYTCISKD